MILEVGANVVSKKRNPKRDEAYEIWKMHDGQITNRAIAEQIDVPEKTISAWKSRDKWNAVLQAGKCSTTKEKRSTSVKKTDSVSSAEKNASSTGKRNRQQRRSGNPAPGNQFTKRNRSAVTHGLFANYIHEEQRGIIDQMQTLSLADQIWTQIEIKFSAIIRMQKIMWVEDEYDHLKVESGFHSGAESSGETYKVAFAYERYESYIKAQTRAMAEYRNLVKQYIELTDEFDERRMKLEGMQLGIEKTKAEIAHIKGDEGEFEDDGFIDAIDSAVSGVWGDAGE